jgi:hypothetical protein
MRTFSGRAHAWIFLVALRHSAYDEQRQLMDQIFALSGWSKPLATVFAYRTPARAYRVRHWFCCASKVKRWQTRPDPRSGRDLRKLLLTKIVVVFVNASFPPGSPLPAQPVCQFNATGRGFSCRGLAGKRQDHRSPKKPAKLTPTHCCDHVEATVTLHLSGSNFRSLHDFRRQPLRLHCDRIVDFAARWPLNPFDCGQHIFREIPCD